MNKNVIQATYNEDVTEFPIPKDYQTFLESCEAFTGKPASTIKILALMPETKLSVFDQGSFERIQQDILQGMVKVEIIDRPGSLEKSKPIVGIPEALETIDTCYKRKLYMKDPEAE